MQSIILTFHRYKKESVFHSSGYSADSGELHFLCIHGNVTGRAYLSENSGGVGIAQWYRAWLVTERSQVLVPGRSSRRSFFCLLQGQLSVLTLISVSIPPLCTTVAYKRYQPFCQKCRCQVTAKNTNAPYECSFKWSDTVSWCMAVSYTQNECWDSISFMWHQPNRAVSPPLGGLFKIHC